jgi:hypothetical protein
MEHTLDIAEARIRTTGAVDVTLRDGSRLVLHKSGQIYAYNGKMGMTMYTTRRLAPLMHWYALSYLGVVLYHMGALRALVFRNTHCDPAYVCRACYNVLGKSFLKVWMRVSGCARLTVADCRNYGQSRVAIRLRPRSRLVCISRRVFIV